MRDGWFDLDRLAVFGLAALVAAGCGANPGSLAPSAAAVATAPLTSAPNQKTFSDPPPTQIPSCLPQCWFGHLTRPGAISGDYTTAYFFGGQLRVTVPDGWWGYEDSTGELAIGLPNDESAGVDFWIDVYAASDITGTPDESVERTGDAVVAWFVDKPIIDVIERAPLTLDGIPAESIEYRRNDHAPNEAPGCPAEFRPCSVAFGYPEWDGASTEGGEFHSKLLVANASWGGEDHTIYVLFWAIGPSYEELVDDVDAIIASVRLPEGVQAADGGFGASP